MEKAITITAKTAALALLAVSGAKYQGKHLSDEEMKPWLDAEKELKEKLDCLNQETQEAEHGQD